jgi:hypothetical protein
MAEEVVEQSLTPVTNALEDSVKQRFEKVIGGELRGDKTVDILRSVEKLMFVQTEFLGSISRKLDKQLSFDREASEDSERREALSSVGGDDDDTSGGKSLLSKVADQVDLGAGPGGFAKKLAGGLLGAFGAKGFFKSLVGDGLKKLGIGDETAEKVSDAAGTGGFASVLTGLFTKGGIGSKLKGGVQGFVAGTVGKLVFDAVGDLDVDKDGKLLGLNKDLVAGTSAAVAGIGSFIATGKVMSKAGSAIKGTLGIGGKPATPGATPKVPKVDAPKTSKTPKITSTKTPKVKIPGGPTLTTNGVASQGKPTSIRGVLGKLPAEKAAKFARFFRVAGPLGAVIPALLEPAMAIYNDEPEAVIRKQTAGALGSIGGGALGALAGGSLGTMLFPGIGSGIGAGLGGLFGAISGEWLIEKMIGAMFDGKDLKEGDLKSEAKKNTRVRGGSKGSRPGSTTPTAKVVSTSPAGGGNQSIPSDIPKFGNPEGLTREALLEKEAEEREMNGGMPGLFEQERRQAEAQEQVKAYNITANENESKLLGKTNAISANQVAKEQASAALIQQNVAKGGDTVTTNTVGGNQTTFNIVKGGGSGSLANGHLPVLQS